MNVEEFLDGIKVINGDLIDSYHTSFKNLKTAEDIILSINDVSEFDLTNLNYCKKLSLENWFIKHINIPNLIKCDGSISFQETVAETISLPKLKSCYNISFTTSTKYININNLENCFDIKAAYSDIKIFKAEKLKQSSNLDFDKCEKLEKIYLPNIKSTDIIKLSNTALKSLNLPKLEFVHSIYTDDSKNLQSIDLNKLTDVYQIFSISNCTKLRFLNLKSLDIIEDNEFYADNTIFSNLNYETILHFNNFPKELKESFKHIKPYKTFLNEDLKTT